MNIYIILYYKFVSFTYEISKHFNLYEINKKNYSFV